MMCQRYLTNVNTAVKEQVKEQHVCLDVVTLRLRAPAHTTV